MKTESIAEGLMRRDTKGGYVAAVRLNKRMKEILLEMINDTRSRTSTTFEEDDEIGLGNCLNAMQWLENKITGNKNTRIRFNIIIAHEIWSWTLDREFHPNSNEKDFHSALQWITNQWNKKYSLTTLMNLADKKLRTQRNGN